MPKVRGYTRRKLIVCAAFLCLASFVMGQYTLKILPVDKDSAFLFGNLELQKDFSNRQACMQYIDNLPSYLQTKGFPTASVDSIGIDSLFAVIKLFVGEAYKFASVTINPSDKKLLDEAGWNEKRILNKPVNPAQMQELRQRLLDYLENSGYPFAKIQLDSFLFEGDKLTASLKIDKGPLYKIDSIRVYGTAKINNLFLQRYLDIKNNSIYQKSKLLNIDRRILELPYLQEQQPSNMTMLGEGSVVNLYLKPKKSSQIDVLLGFLPANQVANNDYEPVRTKLLFTGQAAINLRNSLGNGELIGLNWQQLQQQSPRLNLQYQQPYLGGSPFGVAVSFDLYKKDSSYLNLNFLAGVQYALSSNQTGKVFIQTLHTSLLNVDTVSLRATRKLPNEIDVSSINVGIDYEVNKTNYRLNPRSGYEFQVTASTGTRQIKKNNTIEKLADPDFAYASLYDSIKLKTYQFRIKGYGAKYFQVTRLSTIKTSLSGGWFQSPSIFRNELFQIGGYRLMRGFDEESIFASQYAVATVEYRYLIGLNSFFFVFTDLGWAGSNTINIKTDNSYLGSGLGLAFEIKAGIVNISFAAGKRSDSNFDIRQSKIHLGFVSYF